MSDKQPTNWPEAAKAAAFWFAGAAITIAAIVSC